MTQYRELIETLVQELEPVYETLQERRQVAWWMLEAITGVSRAKLLAQRPSLTPEQKTQLQEWVHQQVTHHKPLQYLIGSVPFLDLSINVEPPVAIPRPETEFWVEKLIDDLRVVSNKQLHILDLCTGSGCIALALAYALPKATVLGIDINEKSLAIARQNQKNNGIKNVEFISSDLFTNLFEVTFDLIVANPPYISASEWLSLDPRVMQWEDERALRADEDGLEIIHAIVDQAPSFLRIPSVMQEHQLPQLVLEIGAYQGPRVRDLLTEHGYSDITIMEDQYAQDRVVRASYRSR